MTGDNPRVTAVIVAIKRLAPEMELPGRTLRSTLRSSPKIFRSLFQKLGNVIDAFLLTRMLAEPDKVEDTDILFFAGLPGGNRCNEQQSCRKR